jgi:branched-chain amino acid transport system substrate-binding protein
MKTKLIASLLLSTVLSLALAGTASADDKVVKIGALSDQSSLYADLGGPVSTLAAHWGDQAFTPLSESKCALLKK